MLDTLSKFGQNHLFSDESSQVEENGSQAGIRLVNEEQRQFMNLAVEEWTAQYKIPVQHPLFFEWVVDPEWNLQVSEASLDSQQWYGVATMAGVAVVLTFLVRFQFLFTKIVRIQRSNSLINFLILGLGGAASKEASGRVAVFVQSEFVN